MVDDKNSLDIVTTDVTHTGIGSEGDGSVVPYPSAVVIRHYLFDASDPLGKVLVFSTAEIEPRS